MINRSWKTTAAGIASIIAAIAQIAAALLDNDPTTVPHWAEAANIITLSIGVILARDDNKTSEQVGASK